MIKSNKWFTSFNIVEKPRIRLICFSYGGTGASVFRKWYNDIEHDVEVIAMQLPGREGRFNEAFITSMNEIIESLLENFMDYLDIPFVFFGHSIGALIAFEFAYMLQNKNIIGLKHLIISGNKPPHIALKKFISHLSTEQLIVEMKKYNGIPDEIINNNEFIEIFLPIIRADFFISETYKYKHTSPLNIPITALGGKNDNTFSFEHLKEWSTYTSNKFSYSYLEGDHFFIHSSYETLIRTVREILEQIGR
jgi:medium-chain acyl-[acyl-carrier-protein] hydrolase